MNSGSDSGCKLNTRAKKNEAKANMLKTVPLMLNRVKQTCLQHRLYIKDEARVVVFFIIANRRQFLQSSAYFASDDLG